MLTRDVFSWDLAILIIWHINQILSGFKKYYVSQNQSIQMSLNLILFFIVKYQTPPCALLLSLLYVNGSVVIVVK